MTTRTEVGLTTGLTDETKTKYGIINNGGSVRGFGTLYTKVDQSLSFTADCAGTLSLRHRVDKAGCRFVLNIMVDGVLYATHTVDTAAGDSVNAYYDLCDLPAGQHTIQIVIASADRGPNGDGNINMIGIKFYEAASAT